LNLVGGQKTKQSVSTASKLACSGGGWEKHVLASRSFGLRDSLTEGEGCPDSGPGKKRERKKQKKNGGLPEMGVSPMGRGGDPKTDYVDWI